ncbi:MAG TPA: nucleotidyltransferase domain-containing protein [Thermoanaerobaculia bacterium]|nr:nucleotidyltransferase domain-containing protein [Thermoanaerobaculia bacterium]
MDDLLERLRQCAASLPEVRLAVLFGSTARGKAGPKSDVDIGVLLEPDTPESRSRVEVDLGRAVSGRDVDVIFVKDAPPLLRFEIARDGVVLRQDEDGLWTGFKAQAMIDWWDWEPIASRIEAALIERLRRKVGHGQA